MPSVRWHLSSLFDLFSELLVCVQHCPLATSPLWVYINASHWPSQKLDSWSSPAAHFLHNKVPLPRPVHLRIRCNHLPAFSGLNPSFIFPSVHLVQRRTMLTKSPEPTRNLTTSPSFSSPTLDQAPIRLGANPSNSPPPTPASCFTFCPIKIYLQIEGRIILYRAQ